MDLNKVIAISALPGLYRMVANKSNGLVVESLEDGKRRFVSARRHNFTPLESISIYTFTDSVELDKVFRNMRDQIEDNPLPASDAGSEELREYFLDVLPDHDTERVHIGDIKKLIRWYSALNSYGLLNDEDQTDTVEKDNDRAEGTSRPDEEEDASPA